MRTTFLSVLAAVLMLVSALPADAQRGTGEPTGVAQQAEKPPVQTLDGTVTDVKVGPCEMTTGRSATGAHLRVETDDDRVVDLHLGPLGAVEHVLEQVPVGQSIVLRPFARTECRTTRMLPSLLSWTTRSSTCGTITFGPVGLPGGARAWDAARAEAAGQARAVAGGTTDKVDAGAPTVGRTCGYPESAFGIKPHGCAHRLPAKRTLMSRPHSG